MDPDPSRLRNILLAEDDPLDVELTLSALEEHLANKVTVVDNGVDALDYLYCRGRFAGRADGHPMLVLLDNKMPKVSGLEVLKVIKADPQLRSIPVVALTSSREAPDLQDFYEHGGNAYVVKPVDFAEFIEAVKQVGLFWASLNAAPPAHDAVPEGKVILTPEPPSAESSKS